MKHIIIFSALTACGVMAAAGDSPDTSESNTGSTAVVSETEKSSEEKSPEKLVRFYVEPNLTNFDNGVPPETSSPIPALIMPNNVCIINTDLAPDRSIEEHIMACVIAQRIRNTITR